VAAWFIDYGDKIFLNK